MKSTRRLATKAGIKAEFGFTGSIEANFERDYSAQTNTNQKLITTHVLLEKEREYILHVNAELLADNATEAFKRDVSKLTPDKLIELYGTHILTDISLGGRFDINYFYTSTLSTVTTQIEASAKASHRKISGSVQMNDEQTSKEIDTNSEFKVLTYGGSLTVDPTSPKEAIASYNKWSTAVEQGSLAFVNATNNIPIWEVVANLKDIENYEQKSEEIEEAFHNIVKETAGKFKDPVYAPIYISEIHIGYGKDESSAKSMLFSRGVLESNILDLDLNKNAGGDWIYLGYKTTYEKSEAITNLVAEYYSKSQSDDLSHGGVKYSIIPVDLNKGAGGKHIYLYYTKEQKAGNPITTIQYLHEKKWQYEHGNGYEPVKPLDKYEALDLNKGAGGDYIWLYFKR